MAITLEQLLRSRDERAVLQQSFLSDYPEGTLLCLTVQLPGEVKRNAESAVIAEAAVAAIREMFPLRLSEQLRDLETGFEAYFVVPLEPLDAKHACCEIEDTHPLGRLMDIDVIVADGQGASAVRPLSRAAIGLPERKCLICDRPARECMRARRHSTAELLSAIEDILQRR